MDTNTLNGKSRESMIERFAYYICMYSTGMVSKEEAVSVASKCIDTWYEAGKEYPMVYHKGLAWYGRELARELIKDRIDKLCE